MKRPAIKVLAGAGREDRLSTGSYVELHRGDPRETGPAGEEALDLPDADSLLEGLFDDVGPLNE